MFTKKKMDHFSYCFFGYIHTIVDNQVFSKMMVQ